MHPLLWTPRASVKGQVVQCKACIGLLQTANTAHNRSCELLSPETPQRLGFIYLSRVGHTQQTTDKACACCTRHWHRAVISTKPTTPGTWHKCVCRQQSQFAQNNAMHGFTSAAVRAAPMRCSNKSRAAAQAALPLHGQLLLALAVLISGKGASTRAGAADASILHRWCCRQSVT